VPVVKISTTAMIGGYKMANRRCKNAEVRHGDLISAAAGMARLGQVNSGAGWEGLNQPVLGIG
jgi:hypothetical protein